MVNYRDIAVAGGKDVAMVERGEEEGMAMERGGISVQEVLFFYCFS